jgi:hypothetical protein
MELNMKKPNGMFTINHETSTGIDIDLGVNKITTNNATDAIKEFTILSINVDISILAGETKLERKA